MATITNYTNLKTELAKWLERSGDTEVTNNVDGFIDLAEARLNRELMGLRKTTVSDATLTGTISSRNIDISSLAFLAPVSLVLTTDDQYKPLRPYVAGTKRLGTTNGYPAAWAMNGDNIELDAPCDQAHTFVFRYHQALDIATDSTNWLLTTWPDAYLFESLKQAAIFFKDIEAAQGYGTIAQQAIDEIKRVELKNVRSQLTVDPALLGRGHGPSVAEFDAGEF